MPPNPDGEPESALKEKKRGEEKKKKKVLGGGSVEVKNLEGARGPIFQKGGGKTWVRKSNLRGVGRGGGGLRHGHGGGKAQGRTPRHGPSDGDCRIEFNRGGRTRGTKRSWGLGGKKKKQ